MKLHVSIILLIIAAASALPPLEVESYHLTLLDFETIPLSEIGDILDCVTYGKQCNPISAAYKAVYPGVFISACELCTTVQKQAGYKFFKRAEKELPGKMDEFKNKFDPEGKYYNAFYDALKASGTA